MPTIDFGSIGAVLSPAEAGFVHTAVELESFGYSTIWLTGGPMSQLSQIADVVRATTTARIATGIIPVDRFPSEEVAALYTDLEREQPGRFVVGLGGAHGSDPFATLNAYLDRLDSVPRNRRVMAALGPRMVALARDRSAGAFPVLVTPQYTRRARATLGTDTTLAVEQLAVLEHEPDQARDIARGPLRVLGQVPAYQASFRRMGFSRNDIAVLSDALIDAVVAWGGTDAIAKRAGELRDAGADHVAISIVADARQPTIDEWHEVARALISR
jgi:probable F420-dependent oxidoreductase